MVQCCITTIRNQCGAMFILHGLFYLWHCPYVVGHHHIVEIDRGNVEPTCIVADGYGGVLVRIRARVIKQNGEVKRLVALLFLLVMIQRYKRAKRTSF